MRRGEQLFRDQIHQRDGAEGAEGEHRAQDVTGRHGAPSRASPRRLRLPGYPWPVTPPLPDEIPDADGARCREVSAG